MTTPQVLTKEFDDMFDKQLLNKLPHHRAYAEAEKEFQSKYNHPKYSSFESYRVSRNGRIKKRKVKCYT
jgi:hypothetical protein